MNANWNDKIIISPSLITLDMCNLEKQVTELKQNGVEMLHVDILDGYFSPSMPLGLDTVRQLRQITNLDFDCHVMTAAPDFFVDELLDIGVQQITFHAETTPHIDGMINKIHAAGVRAGVALKPATPLNALEYVLEKCDTVLLMLINPGYAQVKGEKPAPYAERKIQELRRMINDRQLRTAIELDGRISADNIRRYAEFAQIYVCGSTCIRRDDIAGSVRALMKLKSEV